MADYGEYCIVAEEQCFCVQKPHVHDYCRNCFNRDSVKDIVFRFCTWEFTVKCDGTLAFQIVVKNTTIVPKPPSMVAEIVMWQWDQNNNHQQKIITKLLCNENKSQNLFHSSVQYEVHFIIRLLGKRKLVDDLCRPLDSLASDAFAISVGDQNFVVSAQRLMQISPVFGAMLTDEMREKEERRVDIEDAEPEHFRAFLEVIDPDQNVYPNPINVMGVLKLADRYQVNLVKERCEAHLVNCVEMPLIERLQIAQTFGLGKLKDSILSMGSTQLRAFYKANFDELEEEGNFGKKLLAELHLRLCDEE